MSTEVQPPSTPPPQITPTPSPSSRYPSSNSRPSRQKTAPPTSFPTGSSRRAHGRSSSFTGFVSRILPSHRPEKGHTMRERWDRNSTTSAADLVFGLQVEEADGARRDENAFGKLIQRRGDEKRIGIEVPGSLVPASEGKASRFREEWDGGESKVAVSESIPRRGDGKESRKPDDGKRFGWFFGLKKHEKDKNDSSMRVDTTMNSLEQAARPRLQPSIGPASGLQPTEGNASQSAEVQQPSQDKISRRNQRRSLLDSGDFIGVQGANPRTGMWDVSDATSSSQPSALSEETKRKLEKNAKDIEDKQKRLEEAQAAHQMEILRVQTLRERKRKEKAERRKQELKQRARKYGKWKLSDNGWNSVAAPNLSPIEQSAVGSPVRETPFADRLFPMPSATDPTPYIDSSNIGQQDYFGRRKASSPLRQDRLPFAVGNQLHIPQSMSISRKPVGSPPRRRQDESTATVVRNNNVNEAEPSQLDGRSLPPAHRGVIFETPQPTNPAAREHPIPSSPEMSAPFLDQQQQLPSDPGGKPENQAIATSSPSASTKQDETRHRLAQSLRPTNQGKQPLRLDVLPPISLKSPMQARVPSNSLLLKGPPLVVWAPPTITDNVPEFPAPTTITPTITTTGFARLRPLPAQFDGPSDSKNDNKAKQAVYRCHPCKIPQRMSSQKKKIPNEPQRSKVPHPAVDAGTSSAVSLAPTKKRPNRSFLAASPAGGGPTLRSTSTSTSTSPPNPVKQAPTAENAARLAFERLKFPTVPKNGLSQSFLPTLRRQRGDGMKEYIERELKTATGGQGGIGIHSKNNQIMKSSGPCQKRSFTAPIPPGKGLGKGGDDSLVVWHPKPQPNKPPPGKQQGQNPKAGQDKKPVPPRKKDAPGIADVAVSMMQTAWWFVEPVFDPKSEVRKRCDQHRLTWRDVCLFSVAAVFGVALFLVILACVRVVGMVLTFVKGFLGFLKLWGGL